MCPECGKATIKKSKFPPRGAPQGTPPGFYCFAKIGGCGVEFAPNDPGIVNQSEEKQENPDIAAEFNTVIQMSQKRSFLRAIRMATASSELFTQDIGDGEVPRDHEPPPSEPQSKPEPPPVKPAAKKPPKVEDVYTKARAAIDGAKTEADIIKLGGLIDERKSQGKLGEIEYTELVKLAMTQLESIREAESELQQQKEDPNATI